MSGPAATMAAASSPRALPCAARRRRTQNVATSTASAMSSVMTLAAGEVLATVPRNVPGSSSLATAPHPPEQPDTAQGEHHQVDLPFVDVGCHRLEGDGHEHEQDCRLPVLDAECAKCRDQEHDQ